MIQSKTLAQALISHIVSKEVLLSVALLLKPEIFQEGVCCVSTEAVRICFACPWGLRLKTRGKHELRVIEPVYVARRVSQNSASGCDAHCQSWLSKPSKRLLLQYHMCPEPSHVHITRIVVTETAAVVSAPSAPCCLNEAVVTYIAQDFW